MRGNLYKTTRGGMALLIPYANRIKGGEYEFDNVKYSLPKNKEGNAIHGLVLDKVFNVTKRNKEDEVSLEYLLSDRGYPTTPRCNVTYKVLGRGLSIEIKVKNEGDRRAPLTIGAYPYFVITDDRRVITNDSVKQCLMRDHIHAGEFIETKIEHKGYDDCFLVDG